MTEESAPRRTVKSVQAMRGLAALAVTLYHTHLILLKPEYGGYDVFGSWASRGWAGVNFFFLLSGFIILFAHAKDIGRPARAGAYAVRRFIRVYPVYWIFSAAYVGAALVGLGYPDFRWDIPNLIAGVTLIQVDPAPLPPLQVAWTLFYEVLFYIAFLALVLDRTLGIVVFTGWTAAILIVGGAMEYGEMGPFHMWNIYFMFGMASFALYRRLPRSAGGPLLVTGAALLLFAPMLGVLPSRIVIAQHDAGALLALAAIFAMILTGVTLLERDREWRVPAALILLGDASYSLYLVHSPALSLIAIVHRKAGGLTIAPWLLFLLAAVAATGIGILAHLIVERPLMKVLRGWIARREARDTGAPGALR